MAFKKSGKPYSAAEALKSGVFSTREVLPDEDPAELEALSREYHENFRPATPEERDLVDDLVHYTWLKRRFRRLEALLAAEGGNAIGQTRLQARMDAAHRNYRQSLADLTARQEARRTAEHAAEQPQAPENSRTSAKLGSFGKAPAEASRQSEPARKPDRKGSKTGPNGSFDPPTWIN
jgi:hypothetical protein